MTRFAWLVCVGVALGCGGGPEPRDDDGASGSSDDPASSGDAEPATEAGTSAPPASARARQVHGYRDVYAALPDMGDTQEYFRAHGQRTLVDRGYFEGDVTLAGRGQTKEGEGPGESVIDGHVVITGEGWVLRGLTITGDVEVRGEGNDLSQCEVLGAVRSVGKSNKLPPRR